MNQKIEIERNTIKKKYLSLSGLQIQKVAEKIFHIKREMQE